MVDRQIHRKHAWLRAGLSLLVGAVIASAMAWADLGWFAVLPLSVMLWIICVSLHRTGAVPVIVYHSISPDAGWLPWSQNTSVRPEVFERHMTVLARKGWTVLSREAFQAARARGLRLPAKSVMVHFDDGYLDNWVVAVPILRKFGAPATIFVSSDFIDPSQSLRPTIDDTPTDWRGYMNAAELRVLDADPLIEIACHGADHARVPVSSGIAETLSEVNWRHHAPLSWNNTEDKSRWFEASEPAEPFGSLVRENDSALTTPAWTEEGVETKTAFEARVRASLIRARHRLKDVLGRDVDFLCWPYDRVTNASAMIAREVGFETLTGGRGENREGEDPCLLSRTHINDFAAGPAPLWAEELVFRAKLGVAAGHYWWMPVTALARRRRAKYLPIPKGPGA